jgi:hypothetical protein
MQRIREGFLSGLPWMGRLPEYAVSARVLLHPFSGADAEATVIMLPKEEDSSLEVDDDNLNLGLIRGLGKESWDVCSEERTVIVVVWAKGIVEEDEEGLAIQGTLLYRRHPDDAEEQFSSFECQFTLTTGTLDVQELAFGECTEAIAHVREFSIRNLNDSVLRYRVDTDDTQNELHLSWYDTGDAIDPDAVYELAPKHFVRVHATLHPVRAGERVWKITVENTRNASNICRMAVRGKMSCVWELHYRYMQSYFSHMRERLYHFSLLGKCQQSTVCSNFVFFYKQTQLWLFPMSF